jgi:hypothetical protein
MKIKKLPNVLALHLKRFKYQEDVGKYIKLSYRVAFPMQLRLFNTVDDMADADRLYDLFAIVVHIGKYVPCTKLVFVTADPPVFYLSVLLLYFLPYSTFETLFVEQPCVFLRLLTQQRTTPWALHLNYQDAWELASF